MDLAACLALTREAWGDGVDSSLVSPTDDEIGALLDYTRAVAHAAERRSAPLAAYAAGVALAGLDAGQRVALLRRAAAAIDAEMPDLDATSPPR
jgi:hypothetical protein